MNSMQWWVAIERNMNINIDVTWTNHDKLQVAYDKAVAAGKAMFVFQHNHLVTGYALYMLQYMRQCLPPRDDKTKD